MDTYIYTTTDAREVNAIINNGSKHIVSDLSMQDGETVQTNLRLAFNPSSYIFYSELFSQRERDSIVKRLTRDGQFVVVENGYITTHYPDINKIKDLSRMS